MCWRNHPPKKRIHYPVDGDFFEDVNSPARGGKAVEDYRTPRRWRVHRRPTDGAERLGVRQPSGALGRTLFHPLDHEHCDGLICRNQFKASFIEGLLKFFRVAARKIPIDVESEILKIGQACLVHNRNMKKLF